MIRLTAAENVSTMESSRMRTTTESAITMRSAYQLHPDRDRADTMEEDAADKKLWKTTEYEAGLCGAKRR